MLLERLTNLAIVPPAYVKDKGDAFIAKNPVGSGPYRFVEWARGQRLVVEASPSYWGPAARGEDARVPARSPRSRPRSPR